MKKLVVALMILGIVFSFAGCDAEKKSGKTVLVKFGTGEAKDLSIVTIPAEANDLYWSYTATKKDSGKKFGETTDPTAVTEGKGLGQNFEFSVGTWEFALYGFASEALRSEVTTSDSAQVTCTYTGSTTVKLEKSQSVIPVHIDAQLNTDVRDSKGTLKVSVATPKAGHTVKYNLNDMDLWNDLSTELSLLNGSYDVVLALFDGSGVQVDQTMLSNVIIYKGLVTEVSGQWDDDAMPASFSVQRPYSVSFDTRISGHPIQNQIVKNGSYAQMPADFVPGDTVLYEDPVDGVAGQYYFYGWATEVHSDTTEKGLYNYAVDLATTPVTADITYHAIWKQVPDYLCFTSLDDFAVFRISLDGNATAQLEYSQDGMKTWQEYDFDSIIYFGEAGDKVYVRRSALTLATTFSTSEEDYVWFNLCSDPRLAVSGNIMSLLDRRCETTVIPCDYCFANLFRDGISMVSAPKLPATTLAAHCYDQMFYGCDKLLEAPSLPATELANYCYSSMFSGCKSMATAPSLPATTLQEGCYYEMFRLCEKLVQLPALRAASLVKDCYKDMFYECSSLYIDFDNYSYPEHHAINEYSVPYQAICTTPDYDWGFGTMFSGTQGMLGGNPELGVIYYTNAEIVL